MKALVYEHSFSRGFATKLTTKLARPSLLAPLRVSEIQAPKLPNDRWQRVSPLLAGICGSDLTLISGGASAYLDTVRGSSLVLGHEAVGRLDNGSRVVIDPALGCATRGIESLCPSCSSGSAATCHNMMTGDIAPGPRTGLCKSTGGTWSASFAAHETQLHPVPDDLSDEEAVLIEPAACAVHAVLREEERLVNANVAVVGAGTLGLLVIAVLRDMVHTKSLTIAAKHPHQRAFASDLGANTVVEPSELTRAIRRMTGSHISSRRKSKPTRVAGGVEIAFDCVGTKQSLDQALSIVRPGGRVVMTGMPTAPNADLTTIWQREIELVGSYSSARTRSISDFETATRLVHSCDLGRLVTNRYPLEQFGSAIDHAANAGKRGAFKIAFDFRTSASRDIAGVQHQIDYPAHAAFGCGALGPRLRLAAQPLRKHSSTSRQEH